MTEQVWWYATRAAGLMTWSTAVASVLLGLLLSTRLLGNKPSGPWLLDVHRFLGALSAVFLLIHMGSLWADSYVDFGPAELLVPGQSTWNPSADALGVSAVTWGIGAGYALIAVELTSILRKHMRADLWRSVHYLSIITVAAGSVHAYQAGTDVGNPLVMGIAVGSSVLVVLLSVLRIRGAPTRESPNAKAQLPTEMRRRLDGLPVPEATAQPSLDQPDQSSLPRRAPVRSGSDLDPTSMDDQVSFAPGSGAEPELAAPAGENTLLAGLAATGGPDVFAGVQGDDAEFDPGGWSSELSPIADKMFAQRPTGDQSPTSEPTPPDNEPPDDEPPDDEPSYDEPSYNELSDDESPYYQPSYDDAPTGIEPEVDPRSLLPELQTPPPPPIVEPIFRPAPRAPAPSLAPPPQEPETPDPTPIPPPQSEPVVADRAQVDVWETALESLLGEGLPTLPTFDPPGIPPIEVPAAFEVPETQPVERPAPPSAVVEPISPPAPPPTAPPSLAPPPTAPQPTAPPPLPVDAIDPRTGEADESAYRDWLVEWLAYAERYGDEASADPSRVDS